MRRPCKFEVDKWFHTLPFLLVFYQWCKTIHLWKCDIFTFCILHFKNYMIKALKWIKLGSVANDKRFLVIKFCVIKKFCEKIAGTLKSHTDFKTIQLLQKLSQYHEILHVKSADHDLSWSFFQKLKKITRRRDLLF